MSRSTIAQFTVLQPALELLQRMGYELIDGHNQQFSERERGSTGVVLRARLEGAVRRLNPELDETAIQRGINQLLRPAPAALITMNERSHQLLVAAAYSLNPPEKTLRFFDFEQPASNDFAVVTRFVLGQAEGSQELEAVVFVNGLPLAVMAAITPGDHKALAAAIEHFNRLQREPTFAALFHTVHLLLLLQRDEARYGSLLDEPGQYARWEGLTPIDLPALQHVVLDSPYREHAFPTVQDALLAELLEPRHLLDHFAHCVHYESTPAGRRRRTASVPEHLAITSTARRLTAAVRDQDFAERGGVLWNCLNDTQSNNTVWLSNHLLAAKAGDAPAILLISDREEIVGNVAAAMQHRGLPELVKFEPERRASKHDSQIHFLSIADLPKSRDKLQQVFASPDIGPVIVLLAVTARQDVYDLARSLRVALPQACILVLAELPFPTQRVEAIASVNEYLHVYSPAQAVQYGHHLPVKYEVRLADHQVWKRETRAQFESAWQSGQREAPDLTAVIDAAIHAEGRLAAIMADLAAHYAEDLMPNGGKALLLAHDDEAAITAFEELQKYLPRQIGLWLNRPSKRRKRLGERYDRIKNVNLTLQQFRNDGIEQMALLVTSVTEIAALACPALQVVYVDRLAVDSAFYELTSLPRLPRDHNKVYGLVVDYFGNCNFIEKCLARFDSAIIRAALTFRYAAQEIEKFHRVRRELIALFENCLNRESVEPWVYALESTEIRRIFGRLWRQFIDLFDQLLPDEQAVAQLSELAWLETIRQQAASVYYDEAFAGLRLSKKLRHYLQAEQETFKRVSDRPLLSKSHVLDDLARLESNAAKIVFLDYELRHEAETGAANDPVFFEDLLRRVGQVRRQLEHGGIDEQAALTALRNEYSEVQRRQLPVPGMSPEANAFLSLIDKHLAVSEADRVAKAERHRELAQALLAIIKPETVLVDWSIRSDVLREMRRKIKHHLRAEGYDMQAIEPLAVDLQQKAVAILPK